MRKVLVLAAMGLAMAACFSIALAEDTDKKFEATGELRVRWDRLDNYFDFDSGADDQFSFWPYRARVGISGQLSNDLTVLLEVQNGGSFGNESPTKGNQFPPDQDFDGDSSTAGNRRGDTSIYQAYVKLGKIGGTNLDVTIGRQEYVLSDELILGDNDFYNGNSFDGVKATWNEKAWSATAFYFLTSERNDRANFETNQVDPFRSNDQSLLGATWSFMPGDANWGNIDAYFIRFADGSEDNFRPNLLTLGARWWHTPITRADAASNPWEWSVELAGQKGTAFDSTIGERIKLKGWICNDRFGYNLVSGRALHKIFGTYIRQSGDDDEEVDTNGFRVDQNANGWITLFPDNHGRFGLADFFDANWNQEEASIQAYSLGYSLNLDDGKHVFGARVWKFKPTEDRITVNFVPAPAFGTTAGTSLEVKVKDYGKELDLTYDYQYSKHATLQAGVALLSPGKGLTGDDDPITGEKVPDNTVSRLWGQIRVKF